MIYENVSSKIIDSIIDIRWYFTIWSTQIQYEAKIFIISFSKFFYMCKNINIYEYDCSKNSFFYIVLYVNAILTIIG